MIQSWGDRHRDVQLVMRHRGIKRRNQKSLVGGMERDEHLEWVGEKKKSGERKRKEDRRGGGGGGMCGSVPATPGL